MRIFDVFKKKSGPVRRRKAMTGPHYSIVQGTDALQRERGMAEVRDEEFYLNRQRRLEFLDMCRNAVRNSPPINAILRNMVNSVVGTDGGKLVWAADETDQVRTLKREFKKWCREAEFFQRQSFRDFLAVVLKTLVIGGDCVVVMDTDGLVQDTARLMLFEPDEIGDAPQQTVEQIYGKGSQSKLGVVVNKFGQECGVVVSKSQRGAAEFDPSRSYILKCDPSGSYLDSPYMHVKYEPWRANQVRGISPLASSIATSMDLETVVKAECAVSKKSSQLLA